MQKAIQLTFPDPAKYSNHGHYVSAVARSVSAPENATLITDSCAECIVSQFARSVPIEQQQACGPIVQPTNNCSSTRPSVLEVETAAVLSLGAVPDAWSVPEQWVLLIQLANAILGCKVSGPTQQQQGVASNGTAKQISNPLCVTPGVNYCGPGNSLDTTVAALFLPTVDPCLNAACFTHDNCYASQCITKPCYFTGQTSMCDAPLLATCQGLECSIDLQDPATAFVCGLVKCGTGASLSVPEEKASSLPDLDDFCSTLFLERTALGCNQPPSGCTAPSCPPEAPSPCGEICCACGLTCADGLCTLVCPSGQVPCGTQCCSSGEICLNGTCTVCPSGTTQCGNNCCPGGKCSNGQCACPPGQVPCGSTCCSSAQVCSGGTCACPSGTSPCGSNCCPPGTACSDNQCVSSTCPPATTPCLSNTGITNCCPTDSFKCCPGVGCIDLNDTCCPPTACTTADFCCLGENGFGICCPQGTFCCLSGSGNATTLSCCPSGFTCCQGANQNACCPPLQMCCTDSAGNAFCCGG